MTSLRSLLVAGLALPSASAFAQILIDDFSDGQEDRLESVTANFIFDGRFTDFGSMVGGKREVSYLGQGGPTNGAYVLSTTGGEYSFTANRVPLVFTTLSYDISSVDLLSEEKLLIELGAGTDTGSVFGTVEVTARDSSSSGVNSIGTATAQFTGSGLLEFDIDDLRPNNGNPVDELNIVFRMPSLTAGTDISLLPTDAKTLVVSNIQAVPEPGTMLALGMGGALVALRRRKKQAA